MAAKLYLFAFLLDVGGSGVCVCVCVGGGGGGVTDVDLIVSVREFTYLHFIQIVSNVAWTVNSSFLDKYKKI